MQLDTRAPSEEGLSFVATGLSGPNWENGFEEKLEEGQFFPLERLYGPQDNTIVPNDRLKFQALLLSATQLPTDISNIIIDYECAALKDHRALQESRLLLQHWFQHMVFLEMRLEKTILCLIAIMLATLIVSIISMSINARLPNYHFLIIAYAFDAMVLLSMMLLYLPRCPHKANNTNILYVDARRDLKRQIGFDTIWSLEKLAYAKTSLATYSEFIRKYTSKWSFHLVFLSSLTLFMVSFVISLLSLRPTPRIKEVEIAIIVLSAIGLLLSSLSSIQCLRLKKIATEDASLLSLGRPNYVALHGLGLHKFRLIRKQALAQMNTIAVAIMMRKKRWFGLLYKG